ncbi:MAG: ChaB family protein [Leptolyngbyaceae cyanobacterium bins.349]|nr:ChaB family protein [Leptolyngbyaceae cyanobacterium bins.349]
MDERDIKKYQGENAEEIPEVEDAINAHAGEGERGTMQSPDASQGMMTVDTLPQDVQSALPDEEARQIFIAAYNSIFENNGDRDMAMRVAWQSIDHNEIYTRGEDGKYIRQPMEQGQHNPQPLSAS